VRSGGGVDCPAPARPELTSICEHPDVLCCAFLPNGTILQSNEAFRRFFGVENPTGMSLFSLTEDENLRRGLSIEVLTMCFLKRGRITETPHARWFTKVILDQHCQVDVLVSVGRLNKERGRFSSLN
jgi:hypothetical protein